jgi:hypothetical protein
MSLDAVTETRNAFMAYDPNTGEQPAILDPVIEIGAEVWDQPDYCAQRGKIAKIVGRKVIVNYSNRVSSYPITDITVEFISPLLVLVAGKKETIIHKYVD